MSTMGTMGTRGAPGAQGAPGAPQASLAGLRNLERPRRRNVYVLLQTLFFAVVLIVLLLALVVGVGAYRAIAETRSADSDARVAANLIANSVRYADVVDGVGVAQGPEGAALVFTEHLDSGSFETRYYLYQGHVVQEYAPAGSAWQPARAVALIESEVFTFSYAGGLLSVTTDAGETQIALHSVREGS